MDAYLYSFIIFKIKVSDFFYFLFPPHTRMNMTAVIVFVYSKIIPLN